MNLKQQLVVVSDAYASAVGLSRARVSTIVLNRGATLGAIADGRADVTTSTFEAAMRWFSANWPEGAHWPQEVARPSASQGDDAGPAAPAPLAAAGPACAEAAP